MPATNLTATAVTPRPDAPRQFGRYRIVKELGRGAMGVVHLAEDPALGRKVAIKTITLPADPAERAEYEARFLQEAKAAGGLNHPNIITIHDVGRENDMAYMAMELLDGVELGKLMSQRRLPLPMMLDIGAQIAEGLAFAHQAGVIHRDIKPANIMLVRGTQVKIMDFGIARMRKSEVKTQTGLMLGSPKYMSPEQISGDPIDHRSDIFTLGILLYEMASGVSPFSGGDFLQLIYNIASEPAKPLNRVIPGLPDRLTAIVDRALQKEPASRYQDAHQLANDLRALKAQLENAETSSMRMPTPAPARPAMDSTLRMTSARPGVNAAPAAASTVSPVSQTARTRRGLPPPARSAHYIELPHEREQRLAQEALERAEPDAPPETKWGWVPRYAIGILVCAVLGALLGELGVFRHAELSSYDLSAAEIARFMGYAGALVLLGMSGLKTSKRLRGDSPNAARLAEVLVPLSALIVSAIGYRVSLIIAGPMLSNRARGQFDWAFVIAIGGAALWLAYTLFQQSDRVTQMVTTRFKSAKARNECKSCGGEAGNGKYCAACGAPREPGLVATTKTARLSKTVAGRKGLPK